jgi:gamma-glutamylputrescine oxidase
MTVSLWQASGPLSSVRTDLVVIGAGITGLSAAKAAEDAGLTCVVIDARAPGASASGRNAGFLMRGAAENYAVAADHLGRDVARELWRWTESNRADLEAIGILDLPSCQKRPSCLLAMTDEEADDLVRAHAMLIEDGFEADLLEPGGAHTDDTVWTRGSPKLGLVNPGDAVCNPIELMGLLCARLETSELVTGCEAYAIEQAPDGERAVHTTLGTIHAKRVLIATNAYAGRLVPELAERVRPNRGQMFAAHTPGVRLDFAYYANHGSEYFRQLEPDYVVFGGARTHDEAGERTDVDNLSEAVQGRLEELCRQWLADDFRVISRWAGIMGFSPDEVPLVGPVGGDPAVWFCGGFTGHGMSMAYRTANAAVRSIATDEPVPAWMSIDREIPATV